MQSYLNKIQKHRKLVIVLFRVTYIGDNCKEKLENDKHKIQNCGILGGCIIRETQEAKTELNSLKPAPPPPVPTSRILFDFSLPLRPPVCNQPLKHPNSAQFFPSPLLYSGLSFH